jgi:glycosyltransferase involved in cell wall biosynthesis
MLTVLLATRNREHILRNVLESFCDLQAPSSGWKLIVVDNGSTDKTAQVIASFADRLPLHSVLEKRLGKNCALNTGLEFAEGDLIVLTDDDVFPRADWLVRLREASDRVPEYSIFGGVVLPRWEVPPPSWIQYVDLGPVYTLTGPSWQEGPLAHGLVFGPNMAIRASVFHAGQRFDVSIGPSGSNYAMGSETEFVLRLARQGHNAWHVRGAVVEHFIRQEQLKKAWVLERAIRYGRGQFRLLPSVELCMGVPRSLFREFPKEMLLMAAAWAFLGQEALFRSRWRFNMLRGSAIEARKLARERR